MSGGRSALVLPAQQCDGACSWSDVLHDTHEEADDWRLMSRHGKPARIVRCGRRVSSAMKALPACLQLDPHLCEEVSWRRIQVEELESDIEASFEDHGL